MVARKYGFQLLYKVKVTSSDVEDALKVQYVKYQ